MPASGRLYSVPRFVSDLRVWIWISYGYRLDMDMDGYDMDVPRIDIPASQGCYECTSCPTGQSGGHGQRAGVGLPGRPAPQAAGAPRPVLPGAGQTGPRQRRPQPVPSRPGRTETGTGRQRSALRPRDPSPMFRISP